MAAPGFALGVDLGTSNTVAVLRWPDGRVKPLLFDGGPLLPSAVYAEPGGALLTGRDAVHSAQLDPARYEPNPKRRVDEGTVLLGDTEVPVVRLLAAVLGRVVEEARRTTGGATPEAST
ncbi:MAG TPA: Hsp70 family protein, partial [Rugosimonospora sp.]|nr:Hsp70 family protein [Rugosimonospora sp.]